MHNSIFGVIFLDLNFSQAWNLLDSPEVPKAQWAMFVKSVGKVKCTQTLQACDGQCVIYYTVPSLLIKK